LHNGSLLLVHLNLLKRRLTHVIGVLALWFRVLDRLCWHGERWEGVHFISFHPFNKPFLIGIVFFDEAGVHIHFQKIYAPTSLFVGL